MNSTSRFIVVGYGPDASRVGIESWKDWFPLYAICLEQKTDILLRIDGRYRFRGRLGSDLICKEFKDLSGQELEFYKMINPDLDKILRDYSNYFTHDSAEMGAQ